MIGIIGALNIEVENLISLLEDKEVETISGILYVRGFLYGKEVVIATCGVGKVFAGICTQTMILKYRPNGIINTGVAGGLVDSLSVYDLVIANEFVQHDMDTSGLGDEIGMISGLDIVDIPCSEKLVSSLCKNANVLEYRYHVGKIATGDQFITSRDRSKEIVDTYNAIACDMEGGAIAQVCYINNIDFVGLRCISDGANESADTDFLSFAKEAAERSTKLIIEFIKGYEEKD